MGSSLYDNSREFLRGEIDESKLVKSIDTSTEDLYQNFGKKDTPEKESLIWSTMTEQISTRHYFTMNYVI